MRRAAVLDAALRARENVTRTQPQPVRLSAITGCVVAYTDTQVLVEWVAYGDYHVRWENKWQVQRI